MSTLVSVSSERAKIPELEFSVPLLISPLEILLPYHQKEESQLFGIFSIFKPTVCISVMIG